jgi:serine protease Do
MTPLLPWFAVGALAQPLTPPTPAPMAATYDPARSLAPLVEAVQGAVVTVKIETDSQLGRMMGLDPHSMGPDESVGSGFFVTPEGLVLTNHHVIAEANRITLELADGTSVAALVVGSDAAMDVALLKAEGVDRVFPYVQLGDSDKLRVGDWVVAIGNGHGLGTTVTTGIISGKGRVITENTFGREAFLQTDAAINLGNSGGPLFSLDGQVVGMPTAILQNANSIGFAIPSNLITGLLDDLRDQGRVARGFLGVQQQTLNDELRTSLGVKAPTGALLTNVFAGTPAAEAGLKVGDVVVRIDGEAVETGEEVTKEISDHKPGERVVVTIERNTRQQDVKVVLGERPGSSAPAASNAEDVLAAIGLALEALPTKLAREHGLAEGVLVGRVTQGSPAEGRLRPGDVIVEVDRRPVSSADDVQRLLARATGTVLVTLLRGETSQIVAVPLP